MVKIYSRLPSVKARAIFSMILIVCLHHVRIDSRSVGFDQKGRINDKLSMCPRVPFSIHHENKT